MPSKKTMLFEARQETDLGWLSIVWGPDGLSRLQLASKESGPFFEATQNEEKARLVSHPTGWVADLIARLKAHAQGEPVAFDDVPLDLSRCPPFHQAVYHAARRIVWGKTVTYGELAGMLGRPLAARAVGQALARNPFLLVVPCHRVLGAQNQLGGFSAEGGIATKKKILQKEGVVLTKKPSAHATIDSSGSWAQAEAFLRQQDPILATWMDHCGPCTLAPAAFLTPHAYLCRSILYQQLSGKAAGRIIDRFRLEIGQGEMPTPQRILDASEVELRACGLSLAKAKAVQDLSRFAAAGLLPSHDQFHSMHDEQIVEALVPIRGIGRWTAQMFLMFYLNRPDVLPLQDYGVQKGFQKAYQHATMPSLSRLEQHGKKHWAPFRTVASWYMWRVLDLP